MAQSEATAHHAAWLRRGFQLEWITLGWNVLGVVILAYLAITASSVALAGFGLDSLIEIGASSVVLWELSGTGATRRHRALRLIGAAFIALAVYLTAQSAFAIISGHHASHSVGGIIWTAITAVIMFLLASGKSRVGAKLSNPVLVTEGRVTLIDGLLALAVLVGLVLNEAFGWWWADPIVGFVIVFYAIRESIHIFREPAPKAGNE